MRDNHSATPRCDTPGCETRIEVGPHRLHTHATHAGHGTKRQGWRAGVKGQNIPRVRRVSSQKPLTFFKAHPQPGPSSVSTPVPCAPMSCFFSSLVGPGCITPRPQSEPNRLRVSGVGNDAVMMPRGQKYIQGAEFFLFHPLVLHRGFFILIRSCWTRRLARKASPPER